MNGFRTDPKPDGICNPVLNISCNVRHVRHLQNVNDGVANPVTPVRHTPFRFAEDLAVIPYENVIIAINN